MDDGGFGSGLAEINVGSGLLLVSASLPSLTSSLLSSLSHIMIKSSKSSIFQYRCGEEVIVVQIWQIKCGRIENPVMILAGRILCWP